MKKYLEYIKTKIIKNLQIEKITILDNSDKHAKHKFFDINKYHLAVEIHSKYLVSLGKIASHRRIMKLLDEELKTKLHALEITIK